MNLELFVPFQAANQSWADAYNVPVGSVQPNSYPFGNAGKQAYTRDGLNAAIRQARKRWPDISERLNGDVLIIETINNGRIAEICRFKTITITTDDLKRT